MLWCICYVDCKRKYVSYLFYPVSISSLMSIFASGKARISGRAHSGLSSASIRVPFFALPLPYTTKVDATFWSRCVFSLLDQH